MDPAVEKQDEQDGAPSSSEPSSAKRKGLIQRYRTLVGANVPERGKKRRIIKKSSTPDEIMKAAQKNLCILNLELTPKGRSPGIKGNTELFLSSKKIIETMAGLGPERIQKFVEEIE